MTHAETFRRQRRIKGVSTIHKRSIVIARHKTSISLEDEFWTGLKAIAKAREVPLNVVVGEVDAGRPATSSLSSALRVAVLAHMQRPASWGEFRVP